MYHRSRRTSHEETIFTPANHDFTVTLLATLCLLGLVSCVETPPAEETVGLDEPSGTAESTETPTEESAEEVTVEDVTAEETPAEETTAEEVPTEEVTTEAETLFNGGNPDGFYGLSQDRVDELFADILDGLFTGKTTETITTTDMGSSFGFHFPDMIYVNGEYWGYYITYATSTGKGGVGLATSTDGINWTDKGCVLQPDQDYDCNGAYFAGVWLDTDGTFYLTYECKGGENTKYGTLENIALATSTDGVNWMKEGVILYANHNVSWQKANVGTPDLYKVGDTWYLFFHAFDFTDCRVSVAYGKDLHDLKMHKKPIINTQSNTAWSGTIGRRDVIYCGGYYYMVYEISTDQASTGGYGSAQWSHMFARSRDLINWEITEGPLLTQDNPGFGYDGTCWMVVDNRLYVYMRVGNSTTAVELTLSE